MSALLLALALSRIYYAVPIDALAKSSRTHVEITGTVTLVKSEPDGDVHFRVADAHGHFVVCEIIPTLRPAQPFARPKLGQAVKVRGIRRQDGWHGGWPEVHPVEQWSVVR